MNSPSQHRKRPSVTDFAHLEGIWRSLGYGKILRIEPDRYTLFEETAISCLKVFSGDLNDLCHFYDNLRVSPGGQAFSAHRATGVTRISFRRLNSMPSTAANPLSRDRKNPEYNFEVFWHTFNEQYALFDLKGVDWDKAYRTYRPRIGTDCSRETLFATLAAMLRPLKDGHIRLHSPWGHFDAGASPALFNRLSREMDAGGDDRETSFYLGDLQAAQQDLIHSAYLDNRVRHGEHRVMTWGQLNPTLGYVNIRAMAGMSGKIGHPEEDLKVSDRNMARVLDDLGKLPNMVVDLRSNGGGYDGVALRLASYLMDRKRLAFTKCARRGDGYTGKQAVYVSPASGGTYSGNLFVLTSELTASAAEIFVLALLQRPNLTLIGEPTHGILSDTLERHLPNGWHLTLSNEIYKAFDDQYYEDVGIPPHIRIPYLSRKAREADRDAMLDRVLRLTA